MSSGLVGDIFVIFKFLREISFDHSEQRCILRIDSCQEHIVIILVLIVKQTQ